MIAVCGVHDLFGILAAGLHDVADSDHPAARLTGEVLHVVSAHATDTDAAQGDLVARGSLAIRAEYGRRQDGGQSHRSGDAGGCAQELATGQVFHAVHGMVWRHRLRRCPERPRKAMRSIFRPWRFAR
jgi:hypothetical protein